MEKRKETRREKEREGGGGGGGSKEGRKQRKETRKRGREDWLRVQGGTLAKWPRQCPNGSQSSLKRHRPISPFESAIIISFQLFIYWIDRYYSFMLLGMAPSGRLNQPGHVCTLEFHSSCLSSPVGSLCLLPCNWWNHFDSIDVAIPHEDFTFLPFFCSFI